MGRRDRDEDFEDTGPEQHPALKNFNRVTYQIGHIGKKVLKWAAVGALIVGGLTLIGSMAAGGVIGGIAGSLASLITGPAAFIFGPIGAAAGGAVGAGTGAWLAGTTGLLAKMAMYGAAVFAAVSLPFGLGEAEEAADTHADRMIARYERGEARERQMEAFELQREQQRIAMGRQADSYGLNPNVGMGRGMRGRGPKGGHEREYAGP